MHKTLQQIKFSPYDKLECQISLLQSRHLSVSSHFGKINDKSAGSIIEKYITLSVIFWLSKKILQFLKLKIIIFCKFIVEVEVLNVQINIKEKLC